MKQNIRIGLLSSQGGYATDALVAAGNLPLGAVNTATLKLPNYTCPYGLPFIETGEAVLIASNWLVAMQQQGVNIVSQVLLPLRQRFNRLIGLDHSDPFLLCLADEEVSLMDIVLKVNGIYKDADFNNYLNGSCMPYGEWTEKLAPREKSFKPENLAKLIPSIPCFTGVISALRDKTRKFYYSSGLRRQAHAWGDKLLKQVTRPINPNDPPRATVHFYASLTHIQRLKAVRKLQQSSLMWKGGITNIPPFVTGINGPGMVRLSAAEQATLKKQLSAEDIFTPPLNRFRYQQTMADCKAVLSITGYGELCFRMAEAWANRRVLVCQDISHAQTLFPFEKGRNVVFCRPDLSDLVEILEDIECNFAKYVEIAEQGYADWLEWSYQIDALLHKGFAPLYKGIFA